MNTYTIIFWGDDYFSNFDTRVQAKNKNEALEKAKKDFENDSYFTEYIDIDITRVLRLPKKERTNGTIKK